VYLIKHKGFNPMLPFRPIITHNLIRHFALLQDFIVRLRIVQQMLISLVRRWACPGRSEVLALQLIIFKLRIKQVKGLYPPCYVRGTKNGGNKASILTALSRILSCAANFCTSSIIPRIRRGPSSELTSCALPSKLGGRSRGRSSMSNEVGKFRSCSFLCGIDETRRRGGGENEYRPGGGQVQLLNVLAHIRDDRRFSIVVDICESFRTVCFNGEKSDVPIASLAPHVVKSVNSSWSSLRTLSGSFNPPRVALTTNAAGSIGSKDESGGIS